MVDDLTRYYDLLAVELRQLSFSGAEAWTVIEALRDKPRPTAKQAGSLWAVVEAHLREKGAAGGEAAALVAKLRRLSPAQALATVDAAERYWLACAGGQKAGLGDYLPIRE